MLHRAYAAIPALLPGEIEAQGALRFLVQAVGLKAAAASGVPPPVAPLLGVLLGGVGAAPSGAAVPVTACDSTCFHVTAQCRCCHMQQPNYLHKAPHGNTTWWL